jgi:hypothetical protein
VASCTIAFSLASFRILVGQTVWTQFHFVIFYFYSSSLRAPQNLTMRGPVLISIAALAVGSTAAPSTIDARAAGDTRSDAGCKPMMVIFARGTTETGMCCSNKFQAFADELCRKRRDAVWSSFLQRTRPGDGSRTSRRAGCTVSSRYTWVSSRRRCYRQCDDGNHGSIGYHELSFFKSSNEWI